MANKNIVWFNEVGKADINIVGGKGANLGEMCRNGIPVPYGFIVTANAYFQYLRQSGLDKKIKNFLELLEYKDPKSLQITSGNIQNEIMKTPMPKALAQEIMLAYLDLSQKSKKNFKLSEKLASFMKHPFVAVRSSATAEDLPTASFAGQQDTYLNVSGEANLLKKVHQAYASLFNPRAIFYREEQKFDHMKVGIAIPVQMMVNSHTSGVMFTVDPVTGKKDRLIIEAIYGLGELIVQGAVTPDHYEVDRKKGTILVKKINIQENSMIKIGAVNKQIKLLKDRGGTQKISDDQIVKIAKLGLKIEKIYYFPQDIEWAIEGDNIYVVQTRPITTIKSKSEQTSDKKANVLPFDSMKQILKGDPASPGIAWGKAKVLNNAAEIGQIKLGEVLVAVQTNPDFVPAMKKASAIVTERGGRTSHAAIVSRELGIPAVVGAATATRVLARGLVITVDGSQGNIYQGAPTNSQIAKIQAHTKAKSKGPVLKTATKVYVNLASPTRVEEVAKMNVDGIGLLRAEFMIADIGTHPKKLIREHKEKVFIDKLAADLIRFCTAFNPRPVVYRATDFKTNEYRNLKGGQEFEPEEPNPLLGYRGAYRYISDPKVFELELETIKLIRNKYGYKNLWLMLPFVRTVNELIEVKKIIASSGLSRSSSFKLWMMVEIPSNVILLDKFCEAGIDGVSIGSNDLTMLILGTDRDNTEVAPEFDERNPAVIWAIERVVKTCLKYKVTSSICGQAPSDYPELVEKLVSWGITSISVNPDAVDQVRETVYQAEKKLVNK